MLDGTSQQLNNAHQLLNGTPQQSNEHLGSKTKEGTN